MNNLLIIFGTLLSILSIAILIALAMILKQLKQGNEKKSLPLPRNKINLMEDLSALMSMNSDDRAMIELYVKQMQMRLEDARQHDEQMMKIAAQIRNGNNEIK